MNYIKIIEDVKNYINADYLKLTISSTIITEVYDLE